MVDGTLTGSIGADTGYNAGQSGDICFHLPRKESGIVVKLKEKGELSPCVH